MTPFDFLNAINQSKENLIVDDLTEKDYKAFIVNRGLSYFPDTILHANEMNYHHFLEKKLQFLYLLNSVRPKKRFSKWLKGEKEEDVEVISEYFGYNYKKAKEVSSLLTQDQIRQMKLKLEKGGLTSKEKSNGNEYR
ncbi:MAG: DNA polymerase [Alphaproteobacteria bacterium]|nr:DNA polymerase [Alphaproteobacteria bacterium]